MAILKCKMCGGDLNLIEGSTTIYCEYCGTRQTIPNCNDDKKMNLFARANRLRFACEFDKAAGIYESILADFPEEAEGYWGLVLCKYGIEYVDDPATEKKVPTCHRSSFESIMDDPDYEQALENADAVARSVYRNEARQIEEIRKGIIEVSSKEEPYDIFICYKETAEDGQRTIDSVLAQDVYDVLTDKGYRVFFSRITLEDKLGLEYEPYIFAALNSAKIMLAFGTDYEHYNAVWVKNEWSRYLKLMEKDKRKYLIPCYKGIDAYDMPKEFVRLQAQDLGKVGAVQDLVRGIEKLIGVKQQRGFGHSTQQAGPDCDSLLKRAFMFLEDGEWESAEQYCEKVLDIDPENAGAYVGKLMANLRVKNQEDLKNEETSFEDNGYYQKVRRFGSVELQKTLKGYIDFINERKENERLEGIYARGKKLMEEAKTKEAYKKAARVFESISHYKDSVGLGKECREKAEILKNEDMLAEERFQKLVAEYRVLSKKVKSSSEEQQLKTEIDKLSKEKEQLTQLADAFSADSRKLAETEHEIASKKEKIEALEKERETLGVFAGKRKKEIAENIDVLKANANDLITKATRLKNALGGSSSVDEIRNKINKTEAQITKLQLVFSESEKSKDALISVTNALKSQKDDIYASRVALEFSKVGDYVDFGTYPQGADSNKKEKIQWLVLDKKNGKVMLLSKYGLDCQKYNESCENVTWETCTLRKWLNDEFFNTAFSEKEKSFIPTVLLAADKYSTNPGKLTRDWIFPLSIAEANEYFSSNDERVCEATAYAKGKGAYVGDNGASWWWLRSTGSSQNRAVAVFSAGGVLESGLTVESGDRTVRPALWIDLNAGLF